MADTFSMSPPPFVASLGGAADDRRRLVGSVGDMPALHVPAAVNAGDGLSAAVSFAKDVDAVTASPFSVCVCDCVCVCACCCARRLPAVTLLSFSRNCTTIFGFCARLPPNELPRSGAWWLFATMFARPRYSLFVCRTIY